MSTKRRITHDEDAQAREGTISDEFTGKSSHMKSAESDIDGIPPSHKKSMSETKNSSTSDTLAEHAQGIIDEIDDKRKQDGALLIEFRKRIAAQSENMCDLLEGSLAKLYEKNNSQCQEKLQQLYTVLGRINILEQELATVKESLKTLCCDIDL